MKRDEALMILTEHREELEEFGAERLALFGSVARDEAGPGSDVDLLVEFDGRSIGLFEFAGLQHRLKELLGRKVDLSRFTSLKQRGLEEAVGLT